MASGKCVAIIAGTKEVCQPLYKSLKCSIIDPVYLIGTQSLKTLEHQLTELANEYEVFVFPSNELALNSVYKAMNESGSMKSERIIIPGTAYTDRAYNSKELSNKAILLTMFEGMRFKHFKKLKTSILCMKGYESHISGIQNLKFPVILKPAAKDKHDSFTKVFPDKMQLIENYEQLLRLIKKHKNLLYNRKLLLQEFARGQNISWFGYIYKGRAQGYRIVAIVKSPVDSYGGTTTLAKLEFVDSDLAAAVNEIAISLNLEGIFEIEFILKDGHLYFFYEINPRPILQTSLLLQQYHNIFLEYLRNQGFIALDNNPNSKKKLKFWGSASRYLGLNAGKKISIAILIRTIIYDVRYTNFFNLKEKIHYTFSLLKLAFKNLFIF